MLARRIVCRRRTDRECATGLDDLRNHTPLWQTGDASAEGDVAALKTLVEGVIEAPEHPNPGISPHRPPVSRMALVRFDAQQRTGVRHDGRTQAGRARSASAARRGRLWLRRRWLRNQPGDSPSAASTMLCRPISDQVAGTLPGSGSGSAAATGALGPESPLEGRQAVVQGLRAKRHETLPDANTRPYGQR